MQQIIIVQNNGVFAGVEQKLKSASSERFIVAVG